MAKPELGLKRICPNCGTKYYDLNRNPILCPRCGAPFDTSAVLKARSAAEADDEELEDEETGPAEFVSLDDVAAEEADAAVDIDDPDLDDAGPEDDTFLEDEEDEGDVSDIIGDVEDEEER